MVTDADRGQKLATYALCAAAAHCEEQVGKTIVTIMSTLDGQGVIAAILTWTDTYLEHAAGNTRGTLNTTIDIKFFDTDIGQPVDTAEVPAPERWAGRVLAARATNNHVVLQRLLQELPTDRVQACIHLHSLVGAVARTCMQLPRGFAIPKDQP